MKLKLLLWLPLACSPGFSQGPTVPPPIIQIVSAPGWASRAQRPYARAGAAVDVVGLFAATGLPQTWWIEMHPTFASIEDLDRALTGTALVTMPNDSRAMIAVLQAGWSYRPEEAVRTLSKARYMRVTIYRIRPGTEADLAGLARLHSSTSDRVNSDRPDLFYHVVSGDDAGTYIVLSPLSSLGVLDEAAGDAPAYQTAPKETEIENSREHYLFRVEPGLSVVSDGFAAGDPSFWHP
jgi:hypothetical protein